MGKLWEQLGIADALAKKVFDGGVQLVATGQAEIGIYPASEVAGVKGLSVVGRAAATTDSTAPNVASAFVKFVAAPEHRSVWKEVGFEPPTSSNSDK
jgi:ABC-type molybdate transport system substrate-binding protein